MMLPELALVLDALAGRGFEVEEPEKVRSLIEQLVLDENVLAKRTTNARATTLKKVAELYGLYELPLITRALLMLWTRDSAAKPQLALLCALARDPLLRASADLILDSPIGANVSSELLRERLLRSFPERFTTATMAALASRCAATWAQASHLGPPPGRERKCIRAAPTAVAYAVLIAKLASFSGEAVLVSPWMRALDLDVDGAANLARRAEAEGLLRVRSAGHVYDLEVRGALAEYMGSNGGVTLV